MNELTVGSKSRSHCVRTDGADGDAACAEPEEFPRPDDRICPRLFPFLSRLKSWRNRLDMFAKIAAGGELRTLQRAPVVQRVGS
jgi:hypothetical protein